MALSNTGGVAASKSAPERRNLGTFLGVYTPTILTILGVIMYLRSGWLVGHLGLSQTLVVVALANLITLITALSFSSIATNTHVGVGGAYFIISRSLGLEIGGAIGVPLFLSQTISVTLYSYGLAESLRIVWPEVPVQATAFVIVILVGFLAFLGAKFALRVQLPLMALVGLSLVAFAIGAFLKFSGGSFRTTVPSGEITFWAGFAVFFPAVTGVMAGLGLSGDLRDPGRAIPLGAIAAVLTGFAVYLIVPVLLVMAASSADLREDSLIWTRIAPFGLLLVLPGIWSAIFSSAVGSILGAPRTLQALARDRLAPRFLGRRTGDWKELAPGITAAVVLALAAALLGNLNAVAGVVTMFFLTVYGTINIAAAVETLSRDPSWRPRVRTPWPVNLLGGAACIFAMFLINPLAGAFAILAEISLWQYLSRRERKVRWGDARRGIYESLVRWTLVRLARRPMSARNWRPHVLVFAADPIQHLDLIRFGNWFSQGRGVVTACQLVVGDLLDENVDVIKMQTEMQEALDQEGLVAFAEVGVVRDVVDGIVDVAQANGMAGIESNTVVIGWAKEKARLAEFLHAMKRLERLKKSLIIGRIQPRHLFPREGVVRTVHVWWGGLQRNGDLMLLLAHLLTQNPEWRQSQVKVMSIASNELTKVQTETFLNQLIPRIRIDAKPHVIVKPKESSVQELIQKESARAEVVFMGLATPNAGEEEDYAERLDNLAGDLPAVFFVKNASMFTGELVEPNQTEASEEAEPDSAEEEKDEKA
ncbi:MAG: Na-K-Cl cotransporter [Candidatus Eiseniibacteriota bacterium]|nr:MAG: Na-K-Cl cotransporter [Candidatus Eisenbacteria bacterium]